MSIGIITDKDNDLEVLYCNTTDWAFGPTFEYFDENKSAQNFLDWMDANHGSIRIRLLSDDELQAYVTDWGNRYIDRDRVPFSEVCVIEIEDIFADDYPDFVDAQVSAAEWKEDGRALTEGELESLNYQNVDEVQEAARIQYLESAA